MRADEPLIPVKYVMPMNGNTQALGFNLLSTPNRRDWILAAQKNGRVQATRILHLAQAPNKAGMLVLQPVYRSSVEQGLMENQRQLIGFLVGVFTVDQMIHTALNYSGLDHIDLQLFENHAITPTYRIMSEDNIGPQRQAFNETFHVSLAGQQWQLLAIASQRYILQRLSPQHLPMQLLLMIAASLAAFMMMMQQSRETYLSSEVAHKTRDLDHLARHDPLTGLPNRRAMKEAIQNLATQTTQEHAALLFIDLDRFKLINDTLGHQTGDQLLIYLGQRLQQQLTSDQYLFRMGGDEFLILSPYQNESNLQQLAKHLLAVCSQSVDLANGPRLQVTASIGISQYPRDGKDLDTLIKHADTAMYQAKEQGKNQFFCYTPALTDATREHFELEQSLRQAISQHQLTVYYQPQYTLNDATPCGLEALVRWQHPQKGMISPGTFIPIAEETQLIIPLGWEVLHQVCRQLRRWQHEGLHIKRVAVNLSPVQLMQADFFSQLSRMIDNYGIQPQQLELEITESTLQNDPDYVMELLQRLRHRGHLLSLDDFGTGYSSFRRLKKMPIHRLKIDQGFVRDIGSDQTDEAIIHAMIALGHSLNMSVLAEGVETEEQLNFLYHAGCDEIQGFLTGHPTAAEQVTWKPIKSDLRNRLLLELNDV
ncbi:hypothetical protein BFW38_11795 [Terasakiispira papahanaumokuakeensis]|uniref:cyclic-guanylate-specific phosphodiesterase n=1 Tax=Terasakiispira papahanaumokuakeensis TaxID=197479 RepID=A0A1E2VAR9_9GAMM|nr:EAL domain-containing protein [Terasakiispira papahanaumokuakeensis]ODC04108.1 hypothetical protein BFW38_11795 [Terasakiispira papahanaumokuakeensis]